MGGIFIFHCMLLVIAIIWSIGVKYSDRQLPQNTLFVRNPVEHTDGNEPGNERFYSFAQSRGLRSTFSEGLRQSQVNRLDDELGTEEFPDVPLRVSFKPNENTMIDELKNEVKDLREQVADQTTRIDELTNDFKEQVGLVLQKLDKMDDSEEHL